MGLEFIIYGTIIDLKMEACSFPLKWYPMRSETYSFSISQIIRIFEFVQFLENMLIIGAELSDGFFSVQIWFDFWVL